MDEHQPNPALMTALSTEHFVLQSACSATIAEASARSTLYAMALSSALVALGFTAQNQELFGVFALSVLPLIFLLGLFTTMRLVDTSVECMQFLAGIARIHRHYRTLGPEAKELFARRHGRWPEYVANEPALRFGSRLAQLGTTAAMVAIINNAVAGAVVTLVMHRWMQESLLIPIVLGVAVGLALSVLFVVYQTWRLDNYAQPTPDGAAD